MRISALSTFIFWPFLIFFARGPLAGACFVALSNVLAIFLLYHLARQYFGASVALKWLDLDASSALMSMKAALESVHMPRPYLS